MRRIFGVGEETEDWVNDCSAHVKDGKEWYVTAKSYFFPDDDLQCTVFHPHLMEDKDLFWQTFIHEICECDLVAFLLKNMAALLNNEDTGWQSFATVTHYCTVHALDEPDKGVTLPW